MQWILSRVDPIRRHSPGTRNPSRFVWIALGVFALPWLWTGTSWIVEGLDDLLGGGGNEAALHILAGMFCAAPGVLALLLARYIWRSELRQVEIAQRHPEEPWLWRKEWSTPLLKSRDYTGLVVVWVFTTLWVVGTLTGSVLFLLETPANGHWVGFVVLVFPVVGFWLLASAIRHTVRWRKFGESSFQMERLPAVLGGELAGTLHTKAVEGAEDGVRVRVSCIHQSIEQGGKFRHTREEVLWSDEERIAVQSTTPGSEGVMLPIRFALPSDASPSHALHTHDQVIWRLEASAQLPGADYESCFEIPVFRTPETDPERTMAVLARERPSAVGAQPTPAVPEPLRETRCEAAPRMATLDGVVIDFAPVRWWGAAILLTSLTSCSGFVTWVASDVEDFTGGVLVLGGFTAFLAFAVLHMVGGSTRLRVRSDGVDIQRRLFGMGPTQHVPAARIADLEVSHEMQAGKTTYYQIRLLPRLSRPSWSGERGIKAGARIKGRDKAERIARRMRAILGLSRVPGLR